MASPTSDYQTVHRMALKRQAIPLPDLAGKSVLDVGCEAGYWCKLASDEGASRVLGLDRGRLVHGIGWVDLVAQNRAQGWPRCEFERIDLGKEWSQFGTFDVVLVMSVYHHIYGNCGDHDAIWAWLRKHTADDGVLIWEGPLDTTDSVSRRWAGEGYTRAAILDAGAHYFDPELVGPALHEPTREVLRCTPK